MKKIIINLNFQMKSADGSDLTGETQHCGKFFAHFLGIGTKGNALKMWSWAQQFFKGEEVELDRSDYDDLLKFVKGHEKMPNLAKAQIELAMIDAEKKTNA